MDQRKLQIYFFFIIFLAIFAVSFMIFYPYLYAVAIALVFAIVFKPLHEKVVEIFRGNRMLASFATITIIFITVLVPITLIGTQIFREAESLYIYLTSNGSAEFLSGLEKFINDNLYAYIPGYANLEGVFAIDFSEYARSVFTWVFQNVGGFVSSLAGITINFIIFLFSLYYILKDGRKFKKEMISLSPLSDKYDEVISNKVEKAVNSIIRGSIFVALVQGFLTGIGFAMFGISNPAFWGGVTAIASLVPGLGTAIVTVPAVIYLFASGHLIAATGLLIWGITAVGLVDNFIGPKFIQRGTQIHSFFVLLFVLGGLGFFGPIGFILGPIILSLLFALIDVYKLISKEVVSEA